MKKLFPTFSNYGNAPIFSLLVLALLVVGVVLTFQQVTDTSRKETRTRAQTVSAPSCSSGTGRNFTAVLAGRFEVPTAVDVPGKNKPVGSATVVVSADGTTAIVSAQIYNLTSSQTGAHIHGPASAGQTAGILFPLPNGNIPNTTISLTAQQLQDLRAGKLYLNIHTSNNPNGEMRGQFECADFLETFDGNPATPGQGRFTQLNQPNWDVVIQSRDQSGSNPTWDRLESLDAHHGVNCDPPLNAAGGLVTHFFDGTYEDAVFNCKNHVMTALRADGYGLIYLTPNRMVDFTNGEAVIRWDMSTWRSSGRDWTDIWITPWNDHLQMPFDNGGVDLRGIPKNAVHIEFDGARNTFVPDIIKDFTGTGDFRPFTNDYDWGGVYDSFLTQSPQRRDTFELRISKTHLKICMPAYNYCWADKNITPLTWSQGVVQLGHHSYSPFKDCNDMDPVVKAGGSCQPDTWHWDNVTISNAVPFTMIKADRRFVVNESTPVIFQQPAPANAFLRFGAIGQVAVSFDDGANYQAVSEQPASANSQTDHFGNYWVPIPQGSQSVRFRLTKTGSAPDVRAKDFAIWSASEPIGGPTPTSTVTPTPTSSIPSPTPTQSPVVTNTPTPSPRPSTTVTPTPTGVVRKLGDCNGDAFVNIGDLSTVLRDFGSTTALSCDFVTPIGEIDIGDLSTILTRYEG